MARRSRLNPATDPFSLLLGGIDAQAFLRRHWQKRPRLMRGAIPDFRSFISKEQLFRLACRDQVESRLVLERGGDYPWQVIHGPFRPRDFKSLPRRGWTLLVQNVDLHCREGAMLLRRFAFVPGWRIDDLMVSYAPPGGSVGAHLDSYDVFLLQASGERRWRINEREYGEEDFIPGLDLRIIAGFRPRQDWRLQPGDMLYLPPGVAHHGIATSECLTFSIGFRAPASRELALHHVEEQSADGVRYADPDLRVQAHPGEIAPASRARIRTLVRGALAPDRELDRWFGHHITVLPEGLAPAVPRRRLGAAAFLRLWRKHGILHRAHPSRAAFLREKQHIVLFVNGTSFELPPQARSLAGSFTADWQIRFDQSGLRGPTAALNATLCDMYNAGLLTPSAPR